MIDKNIKINKDGTECKKEKIKLTVIKGEKKDFSVNKNHEINQQVYNPHCWDHDEVS